MRRRLSVRDADARRVSGRRAHAGRRVQHAPRTSRRLRASRRGQRRAARPARRAPHRAHLRRRDSRQRRLRRRARARRTSSSARVNEDFAVESLAGDIFQLGNTSYRILRVEAGRVRVEDAHGQPPTIPFWLGEAPARTDELSHAVSRLRDGRRRAASTDGRQGRPLFERVARRHRPAEPAGGAAGRLSRRRPARRSARCRRRRRIVLERFFDESGGMQLVIHSPFGSRINRAWGLALRKRFCVKFNFELQAAATEDAIVLSLSTSHSFALGERRALPASPRPCAPLLVQAMLDAPMFARALALDRRNVARAAALSRRQEGAGAAAAHARRGSDGGGVSRPDRLRRESRRRARNSRPSAGRRRRSTTACTKRWTSKVWSACCAASSRARSRSSRAT